MDSKARSSRRHFRTLLSILFALQLVQASTLLGVDTSLPPKTPIADRCLALAYSGGGAKGGFEDGALWQMVRNLPPEDTRYEVVSGVSAGAINMGGIGLFPIGDELNATEYSVVNWANLTHNQLWSTWKEGFGAAFTKESGLLNTEPLREYLDYLMHNRTKQRSVITSAVDVESGVYTPMDWDNLEPHEYAKAIVASSSCPGAFPYTELRGRYYMDGGTVWNTNLISAIDKCKQHGYENDEDIVMDVIELSQMGVSSFNATSKTNSWQYFSRYRELKGDYSSLNDLAEFMRAHPKINYRYLVIPSKQIMPGWEILFPHPSLNEKVIEQGKQDAQAILDMGPGESFKKFLNKMDNQ